MQTLNYLIEEFQQKKISFSVIENFMNKPKINIEEINSLDIYNRNPLHNSFLLFFDSEETEEEYTYDIHEEEWNTSEELINFTKNKIKLINWLINCKKDDKTFLNQQDIKGNSPLHLAIIKKYIVDCEFDGQLFKIAKQLITNKNVNLNLVNLDNETPFCTLLIQGINKADSYPTNEEIYELVKLFQESPNFDINVVNNNQQNLLHIIAKEGQKTDFRINFAITKNSNFYQIDINGHTPYEIAILNNNVDMLEIIENHKFFDINQPIDEFSNTILHRAIRCNNKKIIKTLLTRNTNNNLEIDFDIINKNNEKSFKFEDMIIGWLSESLTNQTETEIKIIDFLKKKQCNYNDYITREGLTWWTLAIKYNFKQLTNYLVDSVLIYKRDDNLFQNKDSLLNHELKKEIENVLDDLSYADPEIIINIQRLNNFPNFNDLQKEVLAQRMMATENFKKYQNNSNLTNSEKIILKIYVDAILTDNKTKWSKEKINEFNKIKTSITSFSESANISCENDEQKSDTKKRKLSSSSVC